MNAIKKTTLAVGAILLLGTITSAEAGINDRQRNQRNRIRQGIQSGELTRNEVKMLGKQQLRINRHETKAKSDGTLAPKERIHLNKMLNKSSRQIYRQKHDNQTRP